ncbi:FkbM family methyltransferase [Rhodopseudomonas sp. NSM]|uniref:FkbM family methyltransferase n=1 Tax=Rhodopseudomonas sp. NSM TaxID=3457630 RepID=UPI00403632D0
MNRYVKYLAAAAQPVFWPALLRRVMPALEHGRLFDDIAVGTLIDVGANRGQFSLLVRQRFPKAEIHAFEPLEPERRLLQSVVAAPLTCHPVALGAAQGEATFHVTSKRDSSSLFRPGASQQAASGVTLTGSIKVQVARLTDVLDVAALPRPILMKLDVQGGELDVIAGAVSVLPMIDAIYTEVSFVMLYEQQPLASEITTFLDKHGFALRGVYNHFFAAGIGPTQADFLYVRSEWPPRASATAGGGDRAFPALLEPAT